MNTIAAWLCDLLYPPKCMLCGRLLRDSEAVLCGRCGHELPEWDNAPRRVPGYERCAAAFVYEEPIRGAILRFKFHGMQTYAVQFARWMAVRVRGELRTSFDFVTWTPCSRRRRWSRGFDQAELLAKALARELDLEARPTLEKFRHRPPQSKTKTAAKRRANVQGAYRLLPGADVRGRTVLVVDDILTTGATLGECGRILRQAGAKDLYAAVIAAVNQDENK